MHATARASAPQVRASTVQRVQALLKPSNVVIVGATDKPGNWSQRIWRNLRHYGYPGPVYPLNPSRDEVWGTTCYRSFEALPEPPDHMVVLVPAPAVPRALSEGARAGARSATVMTAGFGEAATEDSKNLAEALKAVIAETGLAVSGPNCLGNLSASASLVTMPDDRPLRVAPGPVAIIGQSGGLAMAIKRTLEERGNATGHVITSGNESGLTTADYIGYFAQETNTRVIVSYLEAVSDPQLFLAACRSARAAGKAVVVVKLGASEGGRAAAMAHTGALAGAMEVFDAVGGRAGCIRVRTLDDIVEVVEFLLHAPLPSGPGLGAITFSGGLRGLLIDRAEENGLRFVDLAPETRQRLSELLTVGTIIGNPLDSGFAAVTSTDAYVKCVQIMLDDPGVDLLLLQEELLRAPGTERKEKNLRAVNALAATAKKPIAFVTMISHGLTDYSRDLRAELANVAFLQEVEKSLRAVRSVITYAAATADRREQRANVAPGPAREVLAGLARSDRASPLSEVDSKRLLAQYGISVPREAPARGPDEAAQQADRIGYPVVLKAVSSRIAHKSNVGGVILGLNDADAVRQAYRAIERNVGRALPGVAIDGVLVAEQIAGGLELVLGMTRDPEMGPVIMFGSGGVALELYKDVAFAALPLDADAASRLIERTRASRLMSGYRGSPPLDRDAAVSALMGLSRLVADGGELLAEIDINPFVLRQNGGVALDALVVLSPAVEMNSGVDE